MSGGGFLPRPKHSRVVADSGASMDMRGISYRLLRSAVCARGKLAEFPVGFFDVTSSGRGTFTGTWTDIKINALHVTNR